MSKSASVISINGNRYDAVSGQLVGAVRKVASQVKSPAGGVIDGMVRRPARIIAKSTITTATDKPSSAGRLSYKAPNVRQRLQHSQTLMRGAVKKPVASVKPAGAHKIPKARSTSMDLVHVGRAKTIAKNSQVKHFGKPAVSAVPRPLKSQAISRPAAKVSPKASSAQLAQAMPSMVTSASHQHLERMLDHALIHADAHKQASKAKAKGWRRLFTTPKWLSIGPAVLAVLLVGGFFAWQNIPQVSMRVAATKAHISASVPAYTPSGFGVAGPAKASDNKVTLSYKSTDNAQQSFAITQQPSSWDSQSVQANTAPTSTLAQTQQVNGTTVYTYGSSNDATWVNHGILFTIQDKANLTSDEIAKIANGL